MDKQAAIVLIIRETNIPSFPVGYQREILAVTNRRFGTLALPGGKVDPGETPLQAAVRELQEEVSVVVNPRDLVLIGHSVNIVADVPDRDVYIYHATIIWGRPTEVERGTALHWRPYDSFARESFFAGFYNKHLPDGIQHLPTTKFLGS